MNKHQEMDLDELLEFLKSVDPPFYGNDPKEFMRGHAHDLFPELTSREIERYLSTRDL
jgi:hypothetical protein